MVIIYSLPLHSIYWVPDAIYLIITTTQRGLRPCTVPFYRLVGNLRHRERNDLPEVTKLVNG